MKGIFFSSMAIMVGLFSTNSHAARIRATDTNETIQTISAVETDAFPGISFLDIARDEQGTMTRLIYRPFQKPPVSYTLDQLRQNWQVLKEVDGYKVIYIGVEKDFDAVKGGHANVRYMQSGMSGSYRNFRILLEPQGTQLVLRSDPNFKDPESDRNRYTGTFNYVFMAKNTFFGKVIGISQVLPAMKSAQPGFYGRDTFIGAAGDVPATMEVNNGIQYMKWATPQEMNWMKQLQKNFLQNSEQE